MAWGSVNVGGGGILGIKSIQKGTVAITSGHTTGTAIVDEINLTCAILILSGRKQTYKYMKNSAYITLTNSTTITATRIGTDGTTTVSYMLIEFEQPFKSIQKGTITISGTNTVATLEIDEVVLDKSFIIYLGQSSIANSSSDESNYFSTLSFNSSTTIQANRGVGIANNPIISYMVIEIN